jgi:hypothetical protein
VYAHFLYIIYFYIYLRDEIRINDNIYTSMNSRNVFDLRRKIPALFESLVKVLVNKYLMTIARMAGCNVQMQLMIIRENFNIHG